MFDVMRRRQDNEKLTVSNLAPTTGSLIILLRISTALSCSKSCRIELLVGWGSYVCIDMSASIYSMQHVCRDTALNENSAL